MCRNPTPPSYNSSTSIDRIINSGATCLVWHRDDTNITKLPYHNPIHAQGPSGASMASTGEGRLKAYLPPTLPNDLLDGHFLPALNNHSIISIGKIVDAGGLCQFDKTSCHCYHPTKGTIISGERRKNGLWYMQNNTADHTTTTKCNQCINNVQHNTTPVTSVYQHTRLREAMQFLHAALFSASKSSVLKAAKAGFLSTWPLLSPTNITKYLSETIATKKGHLSRIRKNVRSTKAPIQPEEDPFDVTQEAKSNEVYLIILDTQNMKETAYSNLTGAFPFTAANGDRYIFVFYSYDANAILLKCMKSRNDAEMMRVYQKCYQTLE